MRIGGRGRGLWCSCHPYGVGRRNVGRSDRRRLLPRAHGGSEKEALRHPSRSAKLVPVHASVTVAVKDWPDGPHRLAHGVDPAVGLAGGRKEAGDDIIEFQVAGSVPVVVVKPRRRFGQGGRTGSGCRRAHGMGIDRMSIKGPQCRVSVVRRYTVGQKNANMKVCLYTA